VTAVLLGGGCATSYNGKRPPESPANGCITEGVPPLSASQDYAGEVLAYFLRVTLGIDGPPEMRKEWRSRGKDVPIDFESITHIMEDIESHKSSMMVLDTDILGLANVLYHYNPRFNQFKGETVFDSLYPSNELIALRLLLVQRLGRTPPIDLREFLRRKYLLCDLARLPSPEDYRATGLDEDEYRLLRAALASEPALIPYLYHPAILAVLEEEGLIRKQVRIEQLFSKGLLPRIRPVAGKSGKVAIAMLPSMITGFIEVAKKADQSEQLVPGERYRKTIEQFKQEILEATHASFINGSSDHPGVPQAPAERETFWKERLLPRVRFVAPNPSPVVIYPGNAREVIENTTPKADLNLVVLGKDVYRCLDLDRKEDVYPQTNRIYLDFSDIRHSEVDEEVEVIGNFILSRILSEAP